MIIDLLKGCDYAFFGEIHEIGEVTLAQKREIEERSIVKINISSDNEEEILKKIEELGPGILIKIIKLIPKPIKHGH